MVKTQCGFWLYPSHFSGAKKKRGVGGRETRERPIILNVPVAQSAKTLWISPMEKKGKDRRHVPPPLTLFPAVEHSVVSFNFRLLPGFTAPDTDVCCHLSFRKAHFLLS